MGRHRETGRDIKSQERQGETATQGRQGETKEDRERHRETDGEIERDR